MSDSSPFERAALTMYGNGYSLLPIVSHNAPFKWRGKAPGTDYLMAGWQNYCIERASIHMTAAWGRRADRRRGGLGLACGFGGVVAVDVDCDDLVNPILAVLPPVVVAKKGRKGATFFFRSTDPLPSKNYSGLLDFLSGRKQTVLPPSYHPDTSRPYEWTTERTLLDTSLDELPAFTMSHFEAMEEVLRAHGWDAPEPALPHGEPVASIGGSQATMAFRQVNDAALASLHAWVPHLGLRRCYRAGSGFKAVAEWRASGSGRAFHLRKPNLSFRADGIRDFGDDRGYSPIDIVMAALGVSASEALAWLAPRVGVQLCDPDVAAMAGRVIASAIRKKA